MFYTFYQNDTDGKFLIDENVAEFVVVEANSASEANEKASLIGLSFYTDNCMWEMVEEWEGEYDPAVFGEYITPTNSRNFDTIVHYSSGKKEFCKYEPD